MLNQYEHPSDDDVNKGIQNNSLYGFALDTRLWTAQFEPLVSITFTFLWIHPEALNFIFETHEDVPFKI